MNEYNLVGSSDTLKALIEKFALRVAERFSSKDINVYIEDTMVDEVVDACEDAGVVCKLI